MNDLKPLITIGITCYNAEDTIGRAVESALAQDWENIEVIIVDDCSEDASWRRAHEFVDRYAAKVRAFRMDRNFGVAACRNRILREACGEFVCFFDDDDVSHESRVSRQYERIVRYERMFSIPRAKLLCHTARLHVFPDGSERYLGTVGMKTHELSPDGMDLARRILTGRPVREGYGACATCSQMAARELYAHLGGFDDDLRRGEDTDLCVRAAVSGCHVIGLPDALVKQYMTVTSDKPLLLERKAWQRIFEKNRHLLQQWGWYCYCHAWMDAKFAYLQGGYLEFTWRLIRLALSHPVLTFKRLCWSAPGWCHLIQFAGWRRRYV